MFLGRFPAIVIDICDGADYTFFPFAANCIDSHIKAVKEAKAYAKKYLRNAGMPITHDFFFIESQSDFHAMIDERRGDA